MEYADKYPHGSFVGFAVVVGVPYNLIQEWARKHPEFGRAKAMARDVFESYWEAIGHDGINRANFKPAIYTFNMRARFGWSDQGPNDQEDDELEWEYE